MQIAKMFASLGFNVDTSGLDKFRQNIKLARTDITNMGRDAGTASTKLTGLSKALDGLSNKLDKVSVKKANDAITKSYENVSLSVSKVEKALKSIETNQKGITKALGKIHGSVKAGEPLWDKYRASVVATKEALKDVNGKMKELRANSTVSLKVNQGNGTSGSQRREQPNNSFFGGMMGGASGGMMGGFFRSMLPAVAIGGALPAAGFAVKEVVQRGREQSKVENTLKMNSQSAEEYVKNLKFIREESNRLGMSNIEFGRAYARLRGDSGDVMSITALQNVMKGFSEYMLVLGSSAENQKGTFRALGQMMTNVTIAGDELNQLAEHGISKGLFQRVAMKYYGLKSMEEYQKFQEARKVKSAEVLPAVAAELAKRARQGGALDSAKNSSLAEQQRLVNKINELSKNIMDSGLDKFLASIFSSLTGIIEHVQYVAGGLASFKKILDGISGGNGILIASLVVLIKLLLNKRKALAAVGKQGMKVMDVFKAFGAFISGDLNSKLLLMARRFIWITALIEGVAFISDQVTKKLAGEENWIDFLIKGFTLLQKVMSNKFRMMKLEIAEMVHMLKPVNWWDKRYETAYYIGGRNVGTIQDWEKKTDKKGQDKKKEEKKGDLQKSYEKYNDILKRSPRLNPWQTMNGSGKPTPVYNNIYLDGKLVHESKIDSYSNNETVNLWGA